MIIVTNNITWDVGLYWKGIYSVSNMILTIKLNILLGKEVSEKNMIQLWVTRSTDGNSHL